MSNVEAISGGAPAAGLEAVSRISKLPVVDSTIELATGIYQKVKVRYVRFSYAKYTQNSLHRSLQKLRFTCICSEQSI